MLAEYFIRDGEGAMKEWRIKGHALVPFWRWVATWGAVVKRPSDLGHDDAGFALPPLRMHDHVVPIDADEPPEAPCHFNNEEATAWQCGWSAGARASEGPDR